MVLLMSKARTGQDFGGGDGGGGGRVVVWVEVGVGVSPTLLFLFKPRSGIQLHVQPVMCTEQREKYVCHIHLVDCILFRTK